MLFRSGPGMGWSAPWRRASGPQPTGVAERLDSLDVQGTARLHIRTRAAGGHRSQLLLHSAWESDQLEDIRDGVVKLYGDFQEGVPLEQANAELSACMAEAQASRDTPSPTSGTSAPHTSAPIPQQQAARLLSTGLG